jgi:hypothetical protein
MNKRIERIGKIKNFLRFQTGGVTVSEIHEALVKRMSLDISRKTIERDVIEMVEEGLVSLQPGMPMRYQLITPAIVEVALKVEEITLILELLDQDSELHQKLKRALV